MRDWLLLGAALTAVAAYLIVFGDDDEGGGTLAPVTVQDRVH